MPLLKSESVSEKVYEPISAKVDTDVFLHGNFIEVGVSGSGSFGTANSAPSGFHPSDYYGGQLGFRADNDGFDQGEEPKTGDFFLPGDPEEGFTVGYRSSNDGEPRNFTNVERNDIIDIPSETTDLSHDDILSAQTVGITSDGLLKVKQIVSFGFNDKFFKNTITITNKSVTDKVYDVRYLRNFDPDQDADSYEEFYTLNTVMENPPQDNRALVKAVGPKSSEPVFLISFDERSRASSFGFNNDDPYADVAYDDDGSKLLKSEFYDDTAIALNTALGDLEPGESVTFAYYTSLNSDFESGLDEIEHDITLSNDSINEHCPDETVVGTLATITPCIESTHNYSLTDDCGGIFKLEGNSLIVADGDKIDSSEKETYNVTVKMTCSKTEKSYYKTFAIKVLPIPKKPLRPVLEGVTFNESSGTYTAHWGWKNENDFTVNVPLSDKNKFTGSLLSDKEGPMSEFVSGRVYNAFTTEFDGSNLVWTLTGPDGETRTATASRDSSTFDSASFLPLRPVLEGVVWNVNSAVYTAHWGWKNENDFPITVPLLHSKFTGNPISGQTSPPNVFEPGRIYDSFTTDFDRSNLVWTLRGPNGETRTATASKDGKILTELKLDSLSYNLKLNEKKLIKVTAVFSDGSTSDVTEKSRFESLNPDICSFNDFNNLTALKAGEGKISASYWGLTISANVAVTSSSSGGGGGGGKSNTAPAVNLLTSGTIIDRMDGYVVLSSPVYFSQAKNTLSLNYNNETLNKNPGKSPRVYYWNQNAKKWIALATFPNSGGVVKAVNENGYTGWFTVFGVSQPDFNDINGHWAEAVINRMNGLGLIEGYKIQNNEKERLVGPDRYISRAEFAVFLFRLLNIDHDKPYVSTLSSEEAKVLLNSKFSDSDKIPEWAKVIIGSLVKQDIISGRSGKFDPNSPITRAEAAVLVSNGLKLIGIFDAADLKEFKDVTAIPDWAAPALSEGVINGYNDGSFKPNNYITRAESLTVLLNLLVKGMKY